MKLTKQILEAIQRGINLAIDDFDDAQDIESQKVGQIKHSMNTRELIRDKYFVDLNLPSGNLWAKYNVGVDPNKLNQANDWYGGYYAWGEIEEKAIYEWRTYKYANGNWDKLTKYCNDPDHLDKNSKLDNLTTLLAEDDVVVQTNKLPWTVKMPTREQFKELEEYTTSEWVENYQGVSGLNGRIFTSKTNGNQLFIPATGFRAISSIYGVGSYCYLWSCSLSQATPGSAYNLYFSSLGCMLIICDRYKGFNVRPVLVQ